MTTKRLPNEGDVIMSRKFAYGYHDHTRTFIHVDGETTTHPVTVYTSEEDRVEQAAKTGKIPPEQVTEDFGAFDQSRAIAQFVVESAGPHGGGGDGHGDAYPDGWLVRARRLDSHGKWDPNGEMIRFYMTGSFMGMINQADVRIVGTMTKMYV